MFLLFLKLLFLLFFGLIYTSRNLEKNLDYYLSNLTEDWCDDDFENYFEHHTNCIPKRSDYWGDFSTKSSRMLCYLEEKIELTGSKLCN